MPNDLSGGGPFNCHDVRNVKQLFPFQFLTNHDFPYLSHSLSHEEQSCLGFTLSAYVDSVPYLLDCLSLFNILPTNLFLMYSDLRNSA